MLCQHIRQKTAKSSVRNFPELRKDNKVLVYKAVCINTLLYGRDAWVTYRCHLKTLEKFHQRCLRKVLCIRWEDRRTLALVPTMEANTISIEAIVMQNQLYQNVGKPSPRQVPFANTWCDTMSWPEKRFKDIAKHCIKKGQIDINAWELIATGRPLWRRSIYQTKAIFETNRLFHEAEKRQRRKERRCLKIFMSPFHLEPPADTAIISADQESRY